MTKTTYSVTFIANYPDGDRYPLKVEVDATDVEEAIALAKVGSTVSCIDKTSLLLISVIPEMCPPATEEANSDGALKPCPFCGNPHVSLVETLRELDGENSWFVNCGCCNASQLPDGKEGAICNWNRRDEPEACSGE